MSITAKAASLLGLDVKNISPAIGATTNIADAFRGQMRDFIYAELNQARNAPETDKGRIDAITTSTVGFTCVRKIAWAAASVEFSTADKKGSLNQESPLAKLLNHPNGASGWAMWQLVYASLAINGKAYILGLKTSLSGKEPRLLQFLRSEYLQHHYNQNSGQLEYYLYGYGNNAKRYEPDEVCEIVHPWFSPDGTVSQIAPAWAGLSLHNGVSGLMRKLLENFGGIPGIIALSNKDEGGLTDGQRTTIRETFDSFRAGGDKYGKIGVLDTSGGDAKFLKITEDLDAIAPIDLKDDALEDVCMVFGVPSLLISGNGAKSTFANQKEARRYFWLDTVVPGYLAPVSSALSAWLGVEVGHDLTGVAALSDYNIDLAVALQAAPLTVNEKRERLGYKPIPGGNTLYMPRGMIALQDLKATSEAAAQQSQHDAALAALALDPPPAPPRGRAPN